MIRSRSIALCLLVLLALNACQNTIYGPRRLIHNDAVDYGDEESSRCSSSKIGGADGADLVQNFFYTACASINNRWSPAVAKEMIEAGVTLNRVRCTDFFAERAGHQTQERIVRGTIAPLSALLTGIIAIANFKSDDSRKDAIQILGIGQSATIAGLELFESEFLFGAANVNSVRTLTMRALDEHAAGILAEDTNFYGAARHLIDHQMICTPANILELSQDAIREGRVVPRTRLDAGLRQLAASGDQKTATMISQSLQAPQLTDDQLGTLWWLSELQKAGAPIDQDRLTVIGDRLAKLPVNPVQGTVASLNADAPLIRSFAPMLNAFSSPILSSFEVTRRLLDRKIAETVPPSVLDRTEDIRFQRPTTSDVQPTRAFEVGISPASTDQ